jgi:hypothetical protein
MTLPFHVRAVAERIVSANSIPSIAQSKTRAHFVEPIGLFSAMKK